MWRKRKALHKEVRKFSFVGIIATITDFILFNICAFVFGWPIITANVVSTTLSSVVSFHLNKQLTFEGRRHGRARTLVRYGLIIGTGIYIIQNSVLYVIDGHFLQQITDFLATLDRLGILDADVQPVSHNIAKLGAVLVASIWNFFMLRRFVFIPSTESFQPAEESS